MQYARNTINRHERARQIHSFEGLDSNVRNIGPTDLDLSQDYSGNCWFWGEGKLKGYDITTGQRKHLENLCYMAYDAGREAVAFVYEHDTPPDCDVIVKNCTVREVFWRGKWKEPRTNQLTVLTFKRKIEDYWQQQGIIL